MEAFRKTPIDRASLSPMRSLLRTIRQFLSELRRRNVYQVAVTYVFVGVFVIEAADLTLTRLGLPPWTVTLVIVLVGLGFPIALVLAWALEMTPEGVRVEEADGAEETAPAPASSPRDLWVGASVLVLLLFGMWWIWSGPGAGPAADSAESTRSDIEDRSVAVLPFEPVNPAQESKTLAQGIHGDLITRLSNVSDLLVKSSESAERYRETQFSLPAIADTLGARWIVDGEVQQVGDQIQVRARLIDPETDANVWAEDYRRTLSTENLFAIQGDITQEIVEGLEAELTADEQNRITGAPTQDLKAYRLYVKGRSSLNRRTEEEMVKAVDYFKRAIRKDSTFALAWAGLATATQLFPIFGPDSMEVQGPTQKEAARRALRLDPGLAEAHDALGRVYTEENNPAAALRHLQRAIDLKPSFAPPYVRLGYLRFWQGRPSATLKLSRLAVEINPGYSEGRIALFSALLATGRYEDALAQARTLQRRHPERAPRSPLLEVYALAHLKRWKEARGKLRQWQAESGPPIDTDVKTMYLALTDIGVRDTSRARKRIAGIQRRGIFSLGLGLIHGALGEDEAALSAWRRYVLPDPGLNPFVTGLLRYYYPDLLGPLRQTPRHEELIRDVNQARGLNPDGSIPQDVDVPTISTDR